MDPEPLGALDGIRVIDLTQVLAGPFCTQILADHGATVIKVESLKGDETRRLGPYRADDERREISGYYQSINRNKQSIAIDLKSPEGRQVLLGLIDGADAIVENSRCGVMERLGLSCELLAERNPKLVYAAIRGFGDPRSGESPYATWPAFDIIGQAMGGMMGVTGPDADTPVKVGPGVGDLIPGLYAAIGILMAAYERERSGQGQYVDMTLHDCGMALLHPQAANFFLNGKRPVPLGNPHPNIAPYEKYATRTCEIFIAVGNDGQFRKLCDLIGRPELPGDPRFASNSQRVSNRAALMAELGAAFAPEDGHELTTRMLRAGLPAGPVLPVDEAMAAPHTAARGMVTELGGYRALGTPIKLSRTPGGTRAAPPRFNEHGRTVLQSRGFSAEEIAALEEGGIVPTKRRK